MNYQSLTNEDRQYFDKNGFLIIENALKAEKIQNLLDVVDEIYERLGGEPKTGRLEVRNCLSHHPLLLELTEHPTILPIIVDLLGPNIKIRSSHLDIRPKLNRESVTNELGKDRPGEPEQWHIDGPLYGYQSIDGILPMMEVKVGYYLTDVTHSGSGTLCIIPGSHKLDYRLLMDNNFHIPKKYIFRVQVAAGSAVIFRTGIWHCVSPNFLALTRKVLYYAYTFRWIEPSDYITQKEELLLKSTPIQRQLLGAVTSTKRHPLGTDPEKKPYSFYWYSEPDDIPLLSWLEGQVKR